MTGGSGSGLRILHVIESLAPGGAERTLVDLCTALQARGHACSVASILSRLELAPELNQAHVRVHDLRVTSLRAIAATGFRLSHLVHRLRPDVVHAHLFFPELAAPVATSFTRPRPVRCVTFHNLAYEAYPVDSAWRVFRRQLERVAARHFDAHLAGGAAIARHYSTNLRLSSVLTVPYACSFPELPSLSVDARAERIAELGMNPAVPLLLLPGSFRIEKGHRYFLEALALLRDRGITVQAAFISTGALLDEITRRTHELRLEERVNFLGVLPSKVDVVTLMSLSDLVVLPSTHEGYPISAIEAMGAGAAVIASAVGGLVELIEHGVTGRLVPPRDSTALAEAIEQLLANDIERRLLGERAVEFVRTRHQADVVAELHEAVYRRMLEARDRPTLP